jgi:hypothetical protein
MNKVLNDTKKLIRLDRIATLGGFGAKRTKVENNPKAYKRQPKHKGNA